MSLTPNYKLTEEWHVQSSKGNYQDPIKLPAGTFVRPIHIDYVPKHVINDPRWLHFDKKNEVFVYTHYGIIAVPKNIVREA